MVFASPLFINWNVTNRCNFDCAHCYSRGVAYTQELETEDMIKIANQFIEANVFQVNFGYGEPLVRGDCKTLIKHLAENNIYVALSTNGWFINEKLARDLKESGLSVVYISLDDINEEEHDKIRRKGSYARVFKAIEYLNEFGVSVRLSTVINKQNFSRVAEFVKLCHQFKLQSVDFKRFRPQGQGKLNRQRFELDQSEEKELFQTLTTLKEKNSNFVFTYNKEPTGTVDSGCPCGQTVLSVRSNGDVIPCNYNSQILGNLLTDSLSHIWKSSDDLRIFRSTKTCVGMGEQLSGSF